MRFRLGADNNRKFNHTDAQWEDSVGAHHVDFDTQLETYNQSVMTYADKRDAEYPDWKTQMDKIYHEGIDAWKADMVQPVKDRFPKT